MKHIILIIIISFCANSYAQTIEDKCNISFESVTLLNTIKPEIYFTGKQNDFPKYNLPDRNAKMFITNQEDYDLIRVAGSERIDFRKYNLFVGHYYTEGCNAGDHIKNRFEVRLIHDYNINSKKLVIVETIAGTSCRMAIPYIIVFKIPKKDCENLEEICNYRNRIRQ